jgi:integrase/recombinase XerC
MAGAVSIEVRDFMEYLKFEKRYSSHTIVSYQNDLDSFTGFLNNTFGENSILEVKPAYIRSWLAEMKDRGFTSKSINRKISSLRSFFKYHLKRGSIKSMPTVNIISPKISKRLPSFLKEPEAKQILNTLATATEDWKSLNAKMIFSLFYATGMRLSELINLNERQLDLGRSQIRVLGKGNKERIITIGDKLRLEINDYLDLKRKNFGLADGPLLVSEKGKKLYPKYVWLLVNQHLIPASTLDKRSPHVLRHSFATHLMNNGAELNAVKELLGHASLAATQVYTHNTIEKLKDVHKRSHPKA